MKHWTHILSPPTGSCLGAWASWRTAWSAWTTSCWRGSTTCGPATTTWAGGTTRWGLRDSWRWSLSLTARGTSPPWRFSALLCPCYDVMSRSMTISSSSDVYFAVRFTVTTCFPAAWRSSPPCPAGLSPASAPAGRRSLWPSRRCWTTGTRAPATWPCRWTAARPSLSAAASTSPTSGWCSARSLFRRVTHTNTPVCTNLTDFMDY